MKQKVIKIVHIDRYPELRKFVNEQLQTFGKIRIVGSSDNSVSAFELIKETTPHVLLTSSTWNDGISLNHFKTFKKLLPSLKIILLTMHDSKMMAHIVDKNGFIDGLVGKNQTIFDLYNCIIRLVEISQFPFSEN